MVRDAVRGWLAEPRPAHAPVRVWRDWALVGGLVSASVLELLLRADRTWWPLVLAVSLVVALTLLWRRTHPWPRQPSPSARCPRGTWRESSRPSLVSALLLPHSGRCRESCGVSTNERWLARENVENVLRPRLGGR
jgi:hypothetical protein